MNSSLGNAKKHAALIVWLVPPLLVFLLGSAFVLLDEYLRSRNIHLNGGYHLDDAAQATLFIVPFGMGLVALQLVEFERSRSRIIATLIYIPLMAVVLLVVFLATLRIWGRLSHLS